MFIQCVPSLTVGWCIIVSIVYWMYSWFVLTYLYGWDLLTSVCLSILNPMLKTNNPLTFLPPNGTQTYWYTMPRILSFDNRVLRYDTIRGLGLDKVDNRSDP